MSWLRLQFTVDGAQVEHAVSLLERFAATSISLSAHSDEALFADDEDGRTYWRSSTICALLDEEVDLDVVVACLRHALGDENLRAYQVDRVDEENWLTSGQCRGEPIVIGERLCISRSWSRAPRPGLPTLHLDPGLAFGSGAHPTTQLCLNWLAGRDLSGLEVIDYGCGSGVLGLAAAILGAADVCAVDIDPQARLATSENAGKNKVELAIYDVADVPLRSFDVLLANILMQPLIALTPTFADLVRPGGHIALSGLLSTQAEACARTYGSFFDMGDAAFHDEWAMLYGIRRDDVR